jgi:predicted dithiol-disulfide oxidoreductase (DUF899 family)
MSYRETKAQLAEYRRQIEALREKMRAAQAAIEPEEVRDYEFARPSGKVKLSKLFGDKDTLFVIHNMGTGCAHCTMWADGFNGVFAHLSDRAAFVVSSPDPPARQQEFASGRGWKFPMISHQGTSFAADMGYTHDGGAMPGVSVFSARARRSCASPTPPSPAATISAPSGTSSISCRKAPPAGSRNSATRAESLAAVGVEHVPATIAGRRPRRRAARNRFPLE